MCGKADYRTIIPGALSFLDKCTLTVNCTGRITIDPTADVTIRSELTWAQTQVIHKEEFTTQRLLVVSHKFGHIGSLIIEVFIQVITPVGLGRIKYSGFKVVSQTPDSVTIDLITPYTGVVVVTDNQYYTAPLTTIATAAWIPPNLLTSNIITIGADIDVADFNLQLSSRRLNSTASFENTLTFKSHSKSNSPVGGTSWAQYRVLVVEKPFFLYSASLPSSVFQKGTTVQLTGSSIPTIVWPMAMSDKSAARDIVTNKLIKNSSIRLGDLVVDNMQLIVANSSIIDDLRKPFTIY